MRGDQNRSFLVDELIKVNNLNGRYTNIQCVNWYQGCSADEKRGCFSLVFKAFDTQENKHVAIKFYDPGTPSDVYRMNSFKREPEILKELLQKKRCLQLVQGMSTCTIRLAHPGAGEFDIHFYYFVTDWIEHDIDDFFFDSSSISAKAKLVLFRQIVSAVEAIHTSNVFHRDLKMDNMRANSTNEDDRIVFIIDFGTAAQYDSEKLLKEYSNVGASGYSAPETFLGFAGERTIAKYTDIYAIGCMLYELFNSSYFFVELENNPHFLHVLTAIASELSNNEGTSEEKLKTYSSFLDRYVKTMDVPNFHSECCSLPKAIDGIIVQLYKGLVTFDYRRRTSNFQLIRTRIDIAIKTLDHELEQKALNEKKRLQKERLSLKLKIKDARIKEFVNGTKRLPC